MKDAPKRARMMSISESMRSWALGLGRELETWPGVILKNAFGMILAYRKGVVFAALPQTRALYEQDAILVKFLRTTPALSARIAADQHFAAGTMEQRSTGTDRNPKGEGSKWRIFLMRDDADVHAAIDWLSEAYQLARTMKHKASA